MHPVAISSKDCVGGLVALHQPVVVAEDDVAGDVEPGGGEGLLGAVHQPRVFGPAGGGPAAGRRGRRSRGARPRRSRRSPGRRCIWRPPRRPARRPAGRGVRVAGRVDAAVRVEGAALEQGPHPFGLVELLAVGRVAGVDREVHRGARSVAGGDRALPAGAKASSWRIIESSMKAAAPPRAGTPLRPAGPPGRRTRPGPGSPRRRAGSRRAGRSRRARSDGSSRPAWAAPKPSSRTT